MNTELVAKHLELEQSYDDTLEALGGALDLKDAETQGHCQRVTAFTICIAKTVPVPLAYLPILARAAFLHDIGKMAIPDSILRKPGPLNNDEKQIMRTHCEIGYNVLTRIPFLRDAADIVLAHHEFFNGTGYPRGLRDEKIPLGARIISIANTFDAMLSDLPYRKAFTMYYVREEIRRCAGTQFDPKIVEVFMSIPEQHWIELRENLGSPFRLTQLKNLESQGTPFSLRSLFLLNKSCLPSACEYFGFLIISCAHAINSRCPNPLCSGSCSSTSMARSRSCRSHSNRNSSRRKRARNIQRRSARKMGSVRFGSNPRSEGRRGRPGFLPPVLFPFRGSRLA